MTTTRKTQIRGPFRFVQIYAGSSEWRVRDAATDESLGTVRPNGSRIRERSWTARHPDGTTTRHVSRQHAAEALAPTKPHSA